MLEDYLQSELEFSRIESVGDGAKIACTLIDADASVVDVALELRVVPGVEGLRTELDAAATLRTDYEVLQQSQVPIVTPRATQRIEAQVPVSSGRRSGEGRGIEPLARILRVADRSGYVRTITLLSRSAIVRDDTGNGAAAYSKVEWRSRFHGHDSRQRPSSHRTPQKVVVAILQERDLINEVDEGDIRAIKQ